MPEITSVELASVSNTDGVPVAKDRLNFKFTVRRVYKLRF